jgi:hypothetical protein
MTTLRQIEANRKNSLLSTGPRSDSGKEQSRRNALKHGLTGDGVVLPEDVEEAVQERYEQWAQEFTPATPYQRFLVEQIALNSVRLDQCSRQEIYERGQLSLRAFLWWDDDRKLAVEQLAQGLAKRPSLIAKQLERSVHGCDWLRERWEALGRILARKGDWSDAERSLALDLLGTPADLRDDAGQLSGDRQALVQQELARLEARKERLEPLDNREREKTFEGKSVEPDARLLRTRRYEAQIRRALSWSMAQYFRVTLGPGLSSPTLGFPVRERAEVAATTAAAPDLAPAPECRPGPEKALRAVAAVAAEIGPAPPPEPDFFSPQDEELPSCPPVSWEEIPPSPRVSSAAPSPAPRLASAQGVFTSALTPAPGGNRRARRARASQARRA